MPLLASIFLKESIKLNDVRFKIKFSFVNLYLQFIIYFCVSKCFSLHESTIVLRPRGVSLSKKVFYSVNEDFICIDGTSTIPFSFVNDDYCDCEDGSDEPGTSACSNAFFHCVNSGHISLNIPSSRVNDNVCDCCDGEDEYNSTIECINTCKELGKQAKEAAQKQQELFEQGYALRQQFIEQGKQIKENNKIKLKNLRIVESEEEEIKAKNEALKNEAENKEKIALAHFQTKKEEQAKKQEEIEMHYHQERERKMAEEAFKDLDLNHDNLLTVDEIQKFSKFDSNHDGTVSEEEAKFFLHMKTSLSLDEFVTTGWMIMKPIYLLDKLPLSDLAASESEEKDSAEIVEKGTFDEPDEEINNAEDDQNNDEFAFDEENEENENDQHSTFAPKEDNMNVQEPEYDDETKILINAANQARQTYKESVEKLDKTKEEIKQLETDIEADFGFDEEFAVLKGQCFDYDDREYTYRFCPFDKASQLSKSGGSDVILGHWGSWVGPKEDKYAKMKYDNGQTCWNGPARSVIIILHCGLENKVLSTSEPNRCEYLFEFSTPAKCFLSQIYNSHHQHTEL